MIQNKPSCSFDPATHTYRIDGRTVPGVTAVLADLLPGWRASDWHLQRGRAVHACCALLAQGKGFEHDPRIAGQVSACGKFLDAIGGPHGRYAPCGVEMMVFNARDQYAGTLDAIFNIGRRRVIVDYKSTLTDTVPIQLAAYARALCDGTFWGMGVELHEDGTYRMSDIYALQRYEREWLALLASYNIRRRLKIKEEEDAE